MPDLVKSNVIQGVPATDIVLRTAIMAALDDIRANPWLLDFCFQSLRHDVLTRKEYGEGEMQELKDWVLNNEIAVVMAHNLNNVRQPAISIEVADSNEIQQVLGDIHHTYVEKIVFVTKLPPLLTFTPAAYDKATGLITLAPTQNTAKVFVGNRVLDRVNNVAYLIEEVVDDYSFRIPADTELNLTRAEVVPADDLWTANCESVRLQEGFNIDCIVQGDPTKTLILEALAKFILYRYKEDLLEARGFENTIIKSSGMTFSTMYGKEATQLLWKRVAMITGWSELSWPKTVSPPIAGMHVGILIPTTSGAPSGDTTAAWDTVLEEDTLGS